MQFDKIQVLLGLEVDGSRLEGGVVFYWSELPIHRTLCRQKLGRNEYVKTLLANTYSYDHKKVV